MKNPLSWLAVKFIQLYQRTLSLDHGPLRFLRPHGQCKFHPTCSEYARQAFLTHGFYRASVLSLRRVGRCHPWSLGGIDDVPKR